MVLAKQSATRASTPDGRHFVGVVRAGWKMVRIAPTVASIGPDRNAPEIISALKKAGHHAAPDSSLASEYPPQIRWKAVRNQSRLKQLLLDPPAQKDPTNSRFTADDILNTLGDLPDPSAVMFIDYTRRGRLVSALPIAK
jgi:hypothetical protein